VLIQLFYIVAPFEILMVYAGTTELTAGMAGGAGIGTIGLLALLSSRLGLSWSADRPVAYMLLFLCSGALSTALTAYGMPAIQRGAINLPAMLAMVVMALVVKQAFVQWPRLFPHVVRITAAMTGVAGLTAIYQSFVGNVLGMRELFDLSFMNSVWGEFWWRPGPPGGLVRAQGIFAEPSFLAAYVGMASGLAMARLGLYGAKLGGNLRDIVPAWAAFSILGSLVLSFSAVVYAGLLATYLGALASKTTFSVRSILFFSIGSAVALIVLVILALQANDAIVNRVAGMMIFSQLNAIDPNTMPGAGIDVSAQLSVQILFMNAYVTLQNLIASPLLGAGVGAHPFAHAAILSTLPDLPGLAPGADTLNRMDASALLLRLLSETGILGTALFTAAILSAWFRARKLVLSIGEDRGPGRQSHKAIAIALNGSLIGVFVAMLLHIPHYYAAEFWGLFALSATLPALASSPSPSRADQRAWQALRSQMM